jgi:hypothetical protein
MFNLNNNAALAADKAARKIDDEKTILKRILKAIKIDYNENSVFDPLWISRRLVTDISMQQHVYITAVKGSNKTWVCCYCYDSKTGNEKIKDHFTVNTI